MRIIPIRIYRLKRESLSFLFAFTNLNANHYHSYSQGVPPPALVRIRPFVQIRCYMRLVAYVQIRPYPQQTCPGGGKYVQIRQYFSGACANPTAFAAPDYARPNVIVCWEIFWECICADPTLFFKQVTMARARLLKEQVMPKLKYLLELEKFWIAV